MIGFSSFKKSLKSRSVGVAVCFGLIALPLAAHADVAQEISMAAEHAGLSSKATNLKMVHAHLHHTLNCLVGPKGHGFDAKQANPCAGMGNGAIADAANAKVKKQLERIASRARLAIANKNLKVAQKDAAKIEIELHAVK